MEFNLDILSRLFPSPFLTILISILIIVACLSGDHLLTLASGSSFEGHGHTIMAMIDNTTHAIIGGLVWAMAENSQLFTDWRKWLNCIFCACLAASIDFDHFIEAGDLSLKKALNLPRRPFLHNTTLILGVVVVLWVLRYFKAVLGIFSLMCLSSWLSHHIRDANHRGLWLFPFGHTPVFPCSLYVILILVLSFFVRFCYYNVYFTSRLKHDTGIV